MLVEALPARARRRIVAFAERHRDVDRGIRRPSRRRRDASSRRLSFACFSFLLRSNADDANRTSSCAAMSEGLLPVPMSLTLQPSQAAAMPRRGTLFARVITYLKVRTSPSSRSSPSSPGPGLNVLTGETGAGKSLLIDSLEFLRGARGSTEMIRGGSDKMTAEAVFQLPKSVRGAAGRARDRRRGRRATRRADRPARDRRRRPRPRPHQRLAALRARARRRRWTPCSRSTASTSRISASPDRRYRELVDEYGGHDALLDATRDALRGVESAPPISCGR